MLEVTGLHVAYGGAPAVSDVSFAIRDGELVSILGPNGAGKTTLVNAIARLLPVRSGDIRLAGEDVTDLPADAMCGRGLALIPEGRRLFTSMTVEENLELGCYHADLRRHRNAGLERVYAIFPILRERRRKTSGTLSGGQQQMVAIGRAMMAQPRLLLIDEPSLGLAPAMVEQVFDTLGRIHPQGVAMLLIEQNAMKALALAQRAYVLERGRIVTEALPLDLLAQPHIRKAYFGEETG
jgi:branched-chain amino acid transport system ATP-binding protein